MHPTDEWREQAVARHAVKNTRLPQEHDKDNRRETGDSSELDQASHPVETRVVCDDGDWVRHIELAVGHYPSGDTGDNDIEEGADEERTNDGDGHVALRIFCFLGSGADRVKPDIGEEDNTRPSHNSAPAEVTGMPCIRWNKGVPVASGDGMSGSPDEDEHNCQFEQDDKVVKVADSLIPTTKSVVTMKIMITAGRLKIAVTWREWRGQCPRP